MFLKCSKTGDLVEIMDMPGLINPAHGSVQGRYHAGEEMQDASDFAKAELQFPSGEALPVCWTDPDYKG